jgi:hypothetical protein
MVMVADLGATQAAEIFLGPIGASAVERIGFLIADALDLKVGVAVGFVEREDSTRDLRDLR